MAAYRICGRVWRFGALKKGDWCGILDGNVLRACDPDGNGIPVPPDALAGAGKYLWEEQGICTLPLTVTVGGERRMLMATVTANKVTQVTVEAGKADFSPAAIPLSCAHPLIGDPVPGKNGVLRVTALRLERPYAAAFPETAGDCKKAWEALRSSVLPEETRRVAGICVGENRLQVRTEGGDVTGGDLCAAAAAGAAAGICRADAVVLLSSPHGDGRGIVRRDRSVLLTLPVKSA